MNLFKLREITPGFWARLIAVAIIDGIAVFALPILIGDKAWMPVVFLAIAVLGINFAYFSTKALPLRWMAPGLFFLTLMLIYPIAYTFFVATTNWASGHLDTKEDVLPLILAKEFEPEVPEEFRAFVYQSQSDPDDLRLLFQRETGELIFGTPRLESAEPLEDAIVDLAAVEVVDDDGDGIPEVADGYRKLNLGEILGIADRIQLLSVDIPEVGTARMSTATSAKLAELRFSYDEERDVLFDRAAGAECTTDDAVGNYVCGGAIVDPGWYVSVGLQNFVDVATNERIREPFLRVFGWNVVYATASVFLQFALGLGLALALNDPKMRGKRIYRTFLILPWAIPAFISVIVWRGLLNQSFGPINRWLEPIFDLLGTSPIPWLTDGFWARVAVILVGLWVGFPYFFLVASGALTSIPASLQEAARVDGAAAPTVFRRITLPLLMVSVAPLLIASFAFNFNNFLAIFLLTEGGPPLIGYSVPVGETDILITWVYDLALASGRGQLFGLAAAITFFIFLIVVIMSFFSLRYTKRLEEVYGNL